MNKSFAVTFLRWLEENRAQSKIGITCEPGKGGLCLSFSVLRENLSGCLYSEDDGWAEIVIDVEYKNEFWDIIFNPELEASQGDRGWFCALCAEQGNSFQFFKTIEDLWIDHLFDPLMGWVNNELARAEALAICGSIESGMTWAALVGDGFQFPPKQEHI
jgi:hypothetical protein